MVRRFDRFGEHGCIHYLSAHALLNLETLGPADFVTPKGLCTYAGIVSYAQHAMALTIGPEVFRRMLFNLALGNTDDHGRNLGFLKPLHQAWALAPAFDLTVVGDAEHALGLGRDGRTATLANAFSDFPRFQLSLEQAQAIWNEVVSAVMQVPSLMSEMEAAPGDLQWVTRKLPLLAHPERFTLPSTSARPTRKQRL